MPPPDLPVTSTSALPADLAALGPSPLIASDDAATYDTLLAGMCAVVRPADMIERAWTRDVVDLVLETLRLRRLKAALMTSCADQGMQKLLDGLNVPGDTSSLARRWAARDLAAVGEGDAVLNAAGPGGRPPRGGAAPMGARAPARRPRPASGARDATRAGTGSRCRRSPMRGSRARSRISPAASRFRWPVPSSTRAGTSSPAASPRR